jgi:hypothetical protein
MSLFGLLFIINPKSIYEYKDPFFGIITSNIKRFLSSPLCDLR